MAITSDLIRATSIVNKAGSGAPALPNGVTLGGGTNVLANFDTIATLPTANFDTPSNSSFVIEGFARQIGDIVFFSYLFAITKGSASGGLNISLPFAARNLGGAFAKIPLMVGPSYNGLAVGASKLLAATMADASNVVNMYSVALNTLVPTPITAAMLDTTSDFMISGFVPV